VQRNASDREKTLRTGRSAERADQAYLVCAEELRDYLISH